MKKIFFYVILIASCSILMAQEMPDNLWQASQPSAGGCEYVANEVIVKFKHTSPVRIQRHNTTRRFVSASVTEVDMVLDSLGIFDMEELMPLTGAQVSSQPKRIRGEQLPPDQNLSKLCNIVFDTTKVQTADEAIMMLERLPEVEYAEPNYIVRVMSSSSADTIYDHLDADTYMAEPLYSQQYGPAIINLPWLWNQPKSKKRPVIAILDTGVDIEHPDLKDNIWSNEAEINGYGGRDDDENGFFDDIHGYDFVNSTGVIGDRNGHGTHCAGIAAAVGNNGIGIAGANPDALIMPIQVMDRTGIGSISNIIKGIDYACANGADILSLSIGGNCYSSAEEEALLKAFYHGKYIVAAAGNEGADIYTPDVCVRKHCFPGAFKFVLGVMSTNSDGSKSGFSNFDEDGPYYSEYDPVGPAFFGDYYNYDIAAPGSNIISTFPNGTYVSMSGTSMSTPLVAGALSRLLQCRTFYSQESCQGLLIQTRDTNTYYNLDVQAAMNFDEFNVNPVLVVSHYHIVDTINGGNGDGLINPGETIEIYPTVKCVYGIATDVSVRINHGLNVDTTAFEIIKREAQVGHSLVPGASIQCQEPIIAKVSEYCGDGYTIQLFPTIKIDSTTTAKTASAYAHKLILEVVEYAILRGILDSAVTLYPDKKYIVDGYFAMDETAELTIKPGVKILMSNGAGLALNKGKLIAKGTPDSLITFTMRAGHDLPIHYIKGDSAVGAIEYAIFDGLASPGWDIFRNLLCRNCIFQNNIAWYYSYYPFLFGGCNLYMCNIINNTYSGFGNFMRSVHSYSCNIMHNVFEAEWGANGETAAAWSHSDNTPYACNLFDNYNAKGEPVNGVISDQEMSKYYMEDPSYFGTYDEEEVRKGLWDLHHNYGISEFIIDNRLAEPSRTAHGIVWKVLINDEELEPYKLSSMPLGVGKHKFDIYFSRPMDVSIAPSISFGVRPPYTQNMVEQDGYWSADSTIYTAYCTITARTMTDGENRILITGAKDYDQFPIPDEKHRFRCIVSAIGSLNTGLLAEAGMGKVSLQWFTDEEDLEDLMGYNIYRWTETEDSIYVEYDEYGNWVDEWQYVIRRDTVVVNDHMLTPDDTEYVDYNVVPGVPYYYMIQQVTTSFQEYDFSHPVAAIPLTAQKGDANGSMSVDVADVVTEVAYLLDKNPKPFIFEAADVNSDNMINIFDIVGTISIITNPNVSSLGSSDNQTATYSIEDGILYIETPVVLGGVQFAFNLDAEVAALNALNGFEQMTWTSSENLNFMAYSMSGNVLEGGKHALLHVGDATIENIILCNAQGHNVPAIRKTPTGLSSIEAMQMRLPSPNPFTTQVNIPYIIGQAGTHQVELIFTNIAGMVVDSYTTTNTFGEYCYTWKPGALLEGVYFVTLYVDGKKMQTNKMIRVK